MIRTSRLAAAAGALSFVGFGAFGAVAAHADGNLPLNSAATSTDNDCTGAPAGGDAWHFILSPNNDSLVFAKVNLNLGDATPVSFTGADIIPNGGQLDNVWVLVPVGKTLTSLIEDGTSADFTGTAKSNSNFNLSHICDRVDQETPPGDDDQNEPPTTPVPTTESDTPDTPGVPTPQLTPEVLAPVPPIVEETTTTAPAPTTAAPVVEAPLPGAPLPPATTVAPVAELPVVPGTLPVTGSSNEILALAAALSLGAGAALVAITRRARKA